MTLLPPFQFSGTHLQREDLWDHVQEIFEDYLHDLTEVGSITFDGLNFTNDRKSMLYLKPNIPVDLYHCQERIFELLKDSGATYKLEKRPHLLGKDPLKTFLPLGRFTDRIMLEQAIDQAKEEFDHPFAMQARHLILFEKTPGQWLERKLLFTFDLSDENHIDEVNRFARIQKFNMGMES